MQQRLALGAIRNHGIGFRRQFHMCREPSPARAHYAGLLYFVS
jgi:hypothetical protein